MQLLLDLSHETFHMFCLWPPCCLGCNFLTIWTSPLNLCVSFFTCFPSFISLSFCPLLCHSFFLFLCACTFLCYNSHLLFLSWALISHVAVSRQLQTHTHAYTQQQQQVFLHMHRYGSHQGKVKGLPHYPAPAKTFGVFYALVSKSRRREMRKGRGGMRYRKSKIMKRSDVI